MDDYSEFVPNVHFEQIPIKDLVSNQSYQRAISFAHVKKAAENFDLYQINPVKVSRRNGQNYVFNGQHTIEIVALVSRSRETPVWCMVYDDLEYSEEADIFANQQRYSKTLLPFEIFKANIEAGNEKQLIIKDLVESYGLCITRSKATGGICAISTLENIYDKYGLQVLDRVLRLAIGAWEGDPNSLSSNMLNGIARLVVCYGDLIKDEIFKEKVGGVSAKEIVRNAKDRHAGSLGYAEAMLIQYNRKMKGGLKWGQLYSSKGPHPSAIIPPYADLEELDEYDEEYEDVGEVTLFDMPDNSESGGEDAV